MECNHVFEGRTDGVHCTICGLHMTHSEYLEYLKAPAKEDVSKAVRQKRKKVEK